MSNHNRKVGGKTKPATNRPPKPQVSQMVIACHGCGSEYLTVVNLGAFDIYKPCDCGAVTHVTGRYHGSHIEMYSGSIEEVVE